MVATYVSSDGEKAAIIEVNCETDFVAKTEEFQKLGKEIAMQVATEEYASTDDLLDAEYVRDAGMKVKDLLAETVAKLGEKIEIRAFTRYSI